MYAKIQPVNYRTGQAKCLVVRSISVQLGSRAVVEWSLMGDHSTDRRDYESGGTQLTGEEYSSWGDDDSYIYTWLSRALELTVDSIEEGNYWDAPPAPPPPAPMVQQDAPAAETSPDAG